jgi:hypothetical protein
MRKISDKIVTKIISFLLERSPSFIDYTLKKIFWTFKYFPPFFTDKKNFEKWESLGWHITEASFYQPIPILQGISKNAWEERLPLNQLTVDKEEQISFAKLLINNCKQEFNLFPYSKTNINWQYFSNNNNFTCIDGEIYYSMIRKFKPQRIVEIGSGYSSFLAYQALQKNQSGTLCCIEPYPRDFFLEKMPSDIKYVKQRLENIDLSFFNSLIDNDILFIDSSHVLKMGSDVEYLFFHVLPKLNKGVIIHFHDIFYPFHYPKVWLLENRYFWNEQYFLLSFLMYNDTFKILLSNSMLHDWEPTYLQENIASYKNEKENPGSIWLVKIK